MSAIDSHLWKPTPIHGRGLHPVQKGFRMNRLEIQNLQQIKQAPCITVTMPTHRTSPENKQDPIRVKNLVGQALDRAAGEYGKREIAPLGARLERLVEDIDYRHLLDGLAVFVNADLARMAYLPFPPQERVVVADSFFTRDLVFALNRTPRYWVLVLSEKPTRLYEGLRDVLVEVQDGNFPRVHEGPGGEQELPGGFGIKKSAYRDEYHRKFFRAVDAALRPFLLNDPLPLAVVGVERYLAFFNEVTAHKDSISTTLAGSHNKTSASELAKLVWPLIQTHLQDQRDLTLSRLEQAVGERKVASGVGEVWRHAAEGRGDLLLVEQDFHYPARVDETGRHILPAAEPEISGGMTDAVDPIIEDVLSKGGRVVFMENGQLEVHQRIALILRY